MKKIWLIGLVVVVALGAVIYSSVSNKDVSAEEFEVLAGTFSERAMEIVWTSEGYAESGLDGAITGEAVMKAFPGLVASDFNNVPAFNGEYRAEGEELVFTGGSARNASYLQADGFRMLMVNSSERLGLKINSEKRVEKLLKELSQ